MAGRARLRRARRLGRTARAHLQVVAAPTPALRQPVLLARSRLDRPAPDRPRRGARDGRPRMPRPLRSRPLQVRRAPAAGVRGPQRRPHPPRSGHVVGAEEHPLPHDRLPQLLRPRAGPRPDPAEVRRDHHPDDPADHRPDRHPVAPPEGIKARLLEHGPAPRREPRAGEDVAVEPNRRLARLAQRLRVPAG